jgi:hypothetical protein
MMAPCRDHFEIDVGSAVPRDHIREAMMRQLVAWLAVISWVGVVGATPVLGVDRHN